MALSHNDTIGDQLLSQAEWLGRLSRALVQDPADASDLAQDTMVAALTKPPSKRGPIKPWLAGVARNIARMRFRSATRRSSRERLAIDTSSPPIGTDELLDHLELQKAIAQKVQALADPYKTVVILRYYEGLSAQEIAVQTACPAGTVRWRLKKGMDQLRLDLDKEYGGQREQWALLVLQLPTTTVKKATTSQGIVLMSTIGKLAIATLAVFCLFWGGSKIGWWGTSSESGKSTGPPSVSSVMTPTSKAQFPRPLRPMREVGPVKAQADPIGTIRLEGQVIDSQEQPVEGAWIAIGTVPPQKVQSDASGSFFFENLPSRDILIEGKKDNTYTGPISLQLTLDGEPVILRLQPSGSVEVVVEDSIGKSVPNAEITIYSLLEWNAITDEEGRAQFTGIGEGKYILSVEASGYSKAKQRLLATGSSKLPLQVRVVMQSGAKVSGRVVDQKGTPVAGARVRADSTSEPFPVQSFAQDGVVSNSLGQWTLPKVPKGNFRILTQASGYAQQATPPMLLDGVNERSEVEIVLQEGAKAIGVVRDQAGHPASRARVRLLSSGSVSWRQSYETFTDSDGRYSFDSLVEGRANIVAFTHDSSSEVLGLQLTSQTPSQSELRLSYSEEIAGRIVDEEGQGVPEAHLHLEPLWNGSLSQERNWSARGQRGGIADSGGVFRFAGLPSGSYRLRASRPGELAALWEMTGQLVNTGDTNVSFLLPETTEFSGTLEFEDGTSPTTFSVRIGGASALPFASKTGDFHIKAPLGNRYLRFTGPEFVQKTIQVSTKKKTKLGAIVVKRGRSISGRIVDLQGGAVSDAQVAIGNLLTGDGKNLFLRGESIGAKTTQSDENGWYSLSGFSQQSLTMVAGNSEGRSHSIRVPSGFASMTLDLMLRPTSSLSGVLRINGKAISETIVIANPIGATSSNFFVLSGSDGSYSFDSLSPGNYIVYPMIGGGGKKPKDMYVKSVQVVEGEEAQLDMDIQSGSIHLEVGVQNAEGRSIPATVFVLGLALPDAQIESLMDGSWLLNRDSEMAPVANLMRTALATPANFSELVPGDITVCVQPLPNTPKAILHLGSDGPPAPLQCQLLRLYDGQSKSITIKIKAL